MRIGIGYVLIILVIGGLTIPTKAQKSGSAPASLSQLEKMTNRFAPTPLRVDTSKLSAGDQQALVKLIWDAAERTGYGKYFTRQASSTEDDHIPFVRMGVNAADVIDLNYPPWHTPKDTMDKLSAHSFQVVGDVISAVLRQLEEMR